MIQLSNNTKYPDIAFEQENIQLSALHSVVILPPLSKIEMGKPLVVEGKTTVKSHSLFDDIRKQALEIEIRNLLIHKERFSKSSTYFAKLSGIYEVYGNKLEAINYAKKASELNHTPDIVYRLGESFLQDGKNEEAFSIFLELKNKKHIESYLRLAESAINNQKFEEADELINEALSLDSLDWRLRLLAGTLAMTRKEFQQAVRHYRVAIDSKPNSSILKHNLAIPYYLLGNTKRALKEAQKAILTNPFNTQALILLADITLKEDNKKSLKNIIKLQYYLESYLSLMPKENSLIGRLADVYLLQNKIKEGIELLSNKKSELKNPMIVNNLGVFWSSKESKVASKYYLDAIHMAGGFDVASQNRGASFAALNLANLLINKKQYKHAEEILLAFTQGASDLKYLEDEVYAEYQLR